MENCIKKFTELDLSDINEVGYKNASIGKMMRYMVPSGILIPNGFALTAEAYRRFITYNNLDLPLKFLMEALDKKSFTNLSALGEKARKLIMGGKMPADLSMAIIDAYDYLFDYPDADVAVRSSAVSYHLSDAGAIGLNESFLNVKGHGALLYAIRQCFASLYTDRAVRHYVEKGYKPADFAMSVGVQQMVRADKGASGVGYTRDPNNKLKDMVSLKAIWGLGEMINRQLIEPDAYLVAKPSLTTTTALVVEKELGSKKQMMAYADDDDETNQIVIKDTPLEQQGCFILSEKEIQHLADWAILVEKKYGQPMCFEWAKDGRNNQLYLIQINPFASEIEYSTVNKTIAASIS